MRSWTCIGFVYNILALHCVLIWIFLHWIVYWNILILDFGEEHDLLNEEERNGEELMEKNRFMNVIEEHDLDLNRNLSLKFWRNSLVFVWKKILLFGEELSSCCWRRD